MRHSQLEARLPTAGRRADHLHAAGGMAIRGKQGSGDIEGVCFGRTGGEGDGHR
jgi:hypothetical protein